MNAKLPLDELLDKLSSFDNQDKNKYVKDPEPPKEADCFTTRDELKNIDLKQDIELKRSIFFHVVCITYIWIFALIGLFIATGISNLSLNKQYLSDRVLMTLVGGASLSVIVGMLSVILKYLFSEKHK